MAQVNINATLARLGRKVEKATEGNNNRGGCCFYAALVSRHLSDLGLESKVVISCRIGYSCNHAWVWFKDAHGDEWFHDSNKTEKAASLFRGRYRVDEYLTPKEGALLFAQGHKESNRTGRANWNRCFNHRRLCGKVATIVRETFGGLHYVKTNI